MSIIAWVLFGLLVGVVANAIDPRPSTGGLMGAIVLGVLGAVVGGWLGSMIFGVGVSGFNIESFIVALVGAGVLLFLGRALRRSY